MGSYFIMGFASTILQYPPPHNITCNLFHSINICFQELNPDGFANTDAVFTLAYAIIMLNVDQHNANVKQQKSMTVEVLY